VVITRRNHKKCFWGVSTRKSEKARKSSIGSIKRGHIYLSLEGKLKGSQTQPTDSGKAVRGTQEGTACKGIRGMHLEKGILGETKGGIRGGGDESTNFKSKRSSFTIAKHKYISKLGEEGGL